MAIVKNTLLSWITDLITTYNFDGIQINDVPEMPRHFLRDFSKAAGTFVMGECYDPRVFFVGGYQGDVEGILNYPSYIALIAVFAN